VCWYRCHKNTIAVAVIDYAGRVVVISSCHVRLLAVPTSHPVPRVGMEGAGCRGFERGWTGC
jgi:hypothetical protein